MGIVLTVVFCASLESATCQAAVIAPFQDEQTCIHMAMPVIASWAATLPRKVYILGFACGPRKLGA